VNRLRIGSARLALEVRDSPAIYIAFDMLANSENVLERFFENWVPRSSPLYLSTSTEDLREVEKQHRRYYRQARRCAVPARG